VRAGDTLVVPKLDRLARSVPDARDIGNTLVACGVRLSLGGSIYDPADPHVQDVLHHAGPCSPSSKPTC
jgi:DNA invertase Pin-like site-specific DNA recombinase